MRYDAKSVFYHKVSAPDFLMDNNVEALFF